MKYRYRATTLIVIQINTCFKPATGDDTSTPLKTGESLLFNSNVTIQESVNIIRRMDQFQNI